MAEPDFSAQFLPLVDDVSEAAELLAAIGRRQPVLVRIDSITKQKAIIALTRYTGDRGRLWVWTAADEWRQFPAGTALNRFEVLPKGKRALHAPNAERGTVIVQEDSRAYQHLRETRKDLA